MHFFLPFLNLTTEHFGEIWGLYYHSFTGSEHIFCNVLIFKIYGFFILVFFFKRSQGENKIVPSVRRGCLEVPVPTKLCRIQLIPVSMAPCPGYRDHFSLCVQRDLYSTCERQTSSGWWKRGRVNHGHLS